MTNKSKMKLKKMNFLKQHRTSRIIAPITRIGAAATLRKLQRVAIQHDKYLNAGLSGKGKETLDASLFFEKIEPSRYTVCSITHTKTRCSIHCYKTSCTSQQTCF